MMLRWLLAAACVVAYRPDLDLAKKTLQQGAEWLQAEDDRTRASKARGDEDGVLHKEYPNKRSLIQRREVSAQMGTKELRELVLKESTAGPTLKEKEATEQLMTLWNASETLEHVITECAKSGKVTVGQNFDLTCEEGHVTTIGIKQEGNASIQDLNLAIKRLPELKRIILDSSKISGDLRDLRAPRDLERLHLRWCRVSGNLKDLEKYSFVALKLSGDISGSLNDLNWSRLKFLDLREAPGVTGDVPTDRGDSPLEGLWLLGTNASGDLIKLLRGHRNMTYLHLQGEGFHGTVADECHSPNAMECTGLRLVGRRLYELSLLETRVKFNMLMKKDTGVQFSMSVSLSTPFPQLAHLDVSGTNLSMNVWDFLKPFADNKYLTKVIASRCGLFGVLGPTLYSPVAFLDLSNNLIEGLEGFPKPGMYLDVSGNTELAAVADAYFGERGPMVLDIQGTKVHMKEEAFDRFLQKEAPPSDTFKCWGARPKASSSNRVLVTPSMFAPDSLCNCAQPGMELVKGEDCCACSNGSAPVRKKDNETLADIECYSCWGLGCDSHTCRAPHKFESDAGIAGCADGYRGTLCSSCSSGYRSVGFSQCEPCQDQQVHIRAVGLAVALVAAVLLLAGALWHYVWKAAGGTTPTERGERLTELLEQTLLFLNYCQLLAAITATHRSGKQYSDGDFLEELRLKEKRRQDLAMRYGSGELGLSEKLAALVEMNVGLILDFFSVQCTVGYEWGLNLEVLITAFCLPTLFTLAMMAAWCHQGSPFYGLKFGIVATSILFPGAVQATAGNLFWCERESSSGLSLDTQAFLHPRPFVNCDGSDDVIRLPLYVALVANVIVIPGGLIILGPYITDTMKGLQSRVPALNPRVLCNSEANVGSVTLQLFSAPLVAEVLGSKEDGLANDASLSEKALLIQAASYATLMSEATGSKKLEVKQIHRKPEEADGEVRGLEIKIEKPDWFQALDQKQQQTYLRTIRGSAEKLSQQLLYRTMAKCRLEEALWIGTRNSFERFADKDPLICEGFQKLLIFGITRLSIDGGDVAIGWVCVILLAASFGIFVSKPYGSRSRNDFAAACYAALALSALLLFFDVDMKTWNPAKWMTCLPGLCLAFYFAHLQLMSGDITLQAASLRQKMEKTLSTSSSEVVTMEVEEVVWSVDLPGQTLLQQYREFMNSTRLQIRSGTIWSRRIS